MYVYVCMYVCMVGVGGHGRKEVRSVFVYIPLTCTYTYNDDDYA